MSPIRMSRIEESARTVIDFLAAEKAGNVAAMLALVSDGCPFDEADGRVLRGRDALAAAWAESQDRVPRQIEELYGMGEHCIVRWQQPGSAGSPERGMDLYRVRGGLIVERHAYVKRA